MDYNPKALFQIDEKRRAWWAEIASSSDFHAVLACTQATLVYQGKDAFHDVNAFIRTMVRLSEDDAMPKPMPSHHLTSFDVPPPSATSTNPPK